MVGSRGSRLLARFGRLVACIAPALAACTPAATPPNLLVVVVDDLGYGDLGAYGRRDAGTPHIDRLAAEGARFTRHYTDSTCSPSRFALLTGRHPARGGFRPSGRGIPDEMTTLPELLRERGYATRHVGKWHLGGTGLWGLDTSPPSALPSAQGFEHWFGFVSSQLLGVRSPREGSLPSVRYGRGRYGDPWLLGSDAPGAHYPGHLTDILTDDAVEFIETHRDGPWYLNLWYLAPHEPIEPAERFAERHPRLPPGRYRALVEQLDANVGRVLDALEDSGQADHTIVLLLSDNGSPATADPASNQPFAGVKVEYREGGVRTPLLIRWPGRIRPGTQIDAVVSILDVFPTIAALVGAPAGDVDGHDLWPLFEGGALPDRPLFWEQALPDGSLHYSVLSPDGRFRLIEGLEGPLLLDLAADPRGASDVLAADPDTAEALREMFRRWRRGALRTSVRLRDADAQGRSLAVGDDLQRSPGWGGFTFGIGITPDAHATHPERDEVIAYQRGLWELRRTPRDALRLRVGDTHLEGKKLRIGACNAVVVTGHFKVSALRPRTNAGFLSLFLDGDRNSEDANVPLPPASDLAAPTLIGRAAAGHAAFHGRLGTPVFLNTRVVEETAGPETSVAELSAELCPEHGA